MRPISGQFLKVSSWRLAYRSSALEVSRNDEFPIENWLLCGRFGEQERCLVLSIELSAALGSRDNDGKHSNLREGGTGYEDSLDVAPGVGRVEEVAFGTDLGEVVGHQSLHCLRIAEAQPYPEALNPGAGGERLALQRVGIGEVPDKVHSLDL